MDNLLPWFGLKNISGIGNHLFKRLIARFGSPELVFQASQQELLTVEGISQRVATAIGNYKTPQTIKVELDQVHQKGYKVVTLADPLYPTLLREIPDPPPVIYVSGKLDGSIKNIAVVGSRNATVYGIAATQKLCADLCTFDITIVSGMAVGIDTAAHQGALAVNGKTIAVLGSGFNKIYPSENLKLFERISETGAVITEFALNTEPEAHNFPIRNRIISGMSMGTIVVEATQSFKSTGTHTLIKQGAKLVENAQDVLEELAAFMMPPLQQDWAQDHTAERQSALAPEELAVYKILSPYPEHIDTIVRKAQIEPGKLLSLLLQLELKGMVQQLPGKFFSILEG